VTVDFKNLLLHVDGRGVATLTLNRPTRHNAFDENVIAELTYAFEHIASLAQARVLVLRGEGKNFCAGADLEWMKRTAHFSHEQNLREAEAMARMLRMLNFLPLPTIASIHGAALGGGVGLVCCCDIAVASKDAVFAFSEVKLGLIPATISPYAIAAIGARAARHYFLTAERFDAVRARELGLVNEVVPGPQLHETVQRTVSTILANSPAAVRAAKQMIFDVNGKAITEKLLQHTSAGIADARASEEGREGVTAFLEKRPPKWVD